MAGNAECEIGLGARIMLYKLRQPYPMNKQTLFVVLFSLAAAVLSASLRGESATATQAAPASPTDDVISNNTPVSPGLTGYYVGSFADTKITVRLDKVIGNTITGYSIVRGNERAFSGWLKAQANGDAEMQMSEPGDDPTDGVFHFQLQGSALNGSWTPNNKSRSTVQLVLTKRDFKYDPHAGKYPQTSVAVLKEEDVSNMKPADLRIMRNEIYARHGYSFTAAEMQRYFDQQDWYMPISTDVAPDLTKVELKNVALIKRYENYTTVSYNAFGR